MGLDGVFTACLPIFVSEKMPMFKPGDTPVPGYSLLGLLGRGQYGEVWEATGPGGTRLAVKIISLAENKGRIELKSVQSVKLIRHANLIPINAIWLLDRNGDVLSDEESAQAMALAQKSQKKNQTLVADDLAGIRPLGYLVICMAKADGSLEQRLERSVESGNVGIDRAELVRYMREAASGLDFLNAPQHLVNGERVGIQHRDIKPANLLLMGDTVVVGDFGVSTTVQEFDATMTAVVGSLAFMAPESFSQKTSPSSDQYALAITYYQLRCNQLPHGGDVSLADIIEIHNQGLLEFDGVTAAEQKVLRRATAMDPYARYGSCREFAEALAESMRTPAVSTSGATAQTTVTAWWALLAALVLAVAALLWFDPGNWLGRRDANKGAPPVNKGAASVDNGTDSVDNVTDSVSPAVRDVVLNLVPETASGTIRVVPRDPKLPPTEVAVAEWVKLQVRPDDQLEIVTAATNPFVGPLERTFTVRELEEMGWKIELPVVSKEVVLGRIDQLVAENQIAEALRLFAQAAQFDASLAESPQPKVLDLEFLATRMAVDPASGAIAVSLRRAVGDEIVSIFQIQSGELVAAPLPNAGNSGSLVEAVGFLDQGRGLLVVRQDGIERWHQDSGRTGVLSGSTTGNGQKFRPLFAVSPDEAWLATADNDDRLQLWNLADPNANGAAATLACENRINNLVFAPDSNSLTVVSESGPLAHLNLPVVAGAELQPAATRLPGEWSGRSIVFSAAVQGSSLVLATDNEFAGARDFFANRPDAFDNPVQIPGGEIRGLVGADGAERFLVESNSDPAVVVFDLSGTTPLASIGNELADGTRGAVFSPDGQWAALTTYDGTLGVIDLRHPPHRWMVLEKLADAKFEHVGFTAGEKQLVAVSTSGGPQRSSRIHLWDFQRWWMVRDSVADAR